MTFLVFSSISLQQHLQLVEYVSKNQNRQSTRAFLGWFHSDDTITLESPVPSSWSTDEEEDDDDTSDHHRDHHHYHSYYHRRSGTTAPGVSIYASWKLPTDIRIVSLHDGGEALQFVGKAGKGVRSLQAPRALPKPRQYTFLKQKTPSPTNGTTTVTKKSWRRRNRNKNTVMETSLTKVTWYPFSNPFTLADGSVCEKDRLISYFEVHILEDPQEVSEVSSLSELYIFQDLSSDPTDSFESSKPVSHSGCVAVGIATADFDRTNSLPGCQVLSFGYHGNDGSLLAETKRTSGTGTPFGSGDVVGCGVDYIKQQVFFTKNGEFVAHVENTMDTAQFAKSKWIPTVGVDAPVRLTVNTTGPFLYDFLSLDTESDGTREV